MWWTEGTNNGGDGWNRCVSKKLDCAIGDYGAFDTCTKSCRANHHQVQAVDHLSNETSQLDNLNETLRDPMSEPWLTPGWSPYGYHTKDASPEYHAWGGR